MSWVIIAVIAVLIGLAVLARTVSGGKTKTGRQPYQKHVALFSPDDRVFYRELKKAMGDDYEIFGKVRVADIVLPRKGSPQKEARHAFSPIAGRHFDFVLCDKKNLTVACVIQLTDKTDPARRPDLGNPIKAVCEAVSLPYVSFHIQADYPAEEMRERLHQAMSKEPFYLVETHGRREPRISNLDDMTF